MKDPNEIVLWILEEVESWTDENGMINKRYSWKIAGRDINLGSINKPNDKIKEIKYAPRGISIKDLI